MWIKIVLYFLNFYATIKLLNNSKIEREVNYGRTNESAASRADAGWAIRC